MSRDSMNIYKNARKNANLTQEALAEQLDISVESIRAYETGQRIPPDEIVDEMGKKFCDSRLCYDHLQGSNPIAAQVLPKLSDKSLLGTTVTFFNLLRSVAEDEEAARLLRIAEDDTVDEEETEEFRSIVYGKLQGIARCYHELDMHCRATG